MLVAFEHVLPERLDLLHVTAFAIYWDSGQEESFREFTF